MRIFFAVLRLGLVACLLSGCATTAQSGAASRIPRSSRRAPSQQSARARGLVVTHEVRRQLVAAAAEVKGDVPVSGYRGLEPGQTYYAYDPATATYWAGAALVPREDSTAAQISVQDNGSYDLFRRHTGGSWKAYEVGLAGVGGTRCPVALPRAVAHLWGWSKGGCHPPRQG